jgi:hypothetical protein
VERNALLKFHCVIDVHTRSSQSARSPRIDVPDLPETGIFLDLPHACRTSFFDDAILVWNLIGSPVQYFSLIRLQSGDQKLFDGFNGRCCRFFVIAKMWTPFDAWITCDIVGLAGLAVYDQSMFTLFQQAVAGGSGLHTLGFGSEEEKIVAVLRSGIFGKDGVRSGLP